MLSSGARIDPRIIRTRKLLIDAFVQLLAEQPFEAITVADITARATVNRATFYAHFPDKYALVDELIHAGFAQVLQARLALPTRAVPAYLRQLLLAVTDHWTALNAHCQHSYRVFAQLVEAQVKAQLRDSVRSWLEEWSAPQAVSRQQLDLAATIVSAGLYAAAMEWAHSGGTQPAEAFADVAIPLIAASVTALGGARAR